MSNGFTVIHEFNLGKGIDARSAENQITEGYCEDALNADFTETRVEKRKGYQQFSSYVPLRVKAVSLSGNDICIDFDTSIDVTRLTPGPIRLAGRTALSWAALDGTTVNAGTYADHWYSTYTISLRQVFPSATETTATSTEIPPEIHGFNSASLFAGITESTSQTNLSGSIFIPDDITISKLASSDELNTGTTFTGTQGLEWIPYFLNAEEAPNFAGFQATLNTSATDIDIDADVTSSVNLTTGVVNGPKLNDLRNFNYIVQVWEMNAANYWDATSLTYVLPDNIFIDADGNLKVVIERPQTPAADKYYFITVHTPVSSNIINGSIPANGEVTETIASDNAFIFPMIYSSTGTTREAILPDSVVYDDVARTHTVKFVANNSSDNYQIYWAFGSLLVNQICIPTAATFTSSSTTDVEMDVYGIDPEGIYPTADRGSWVTHIDSYRSAGIGKLVIGSGGNFYSNTDRNNPTLLPDTGLTITDPVNIAPAFQATGTTVTRDRGVITFNNDVNNRAQGGFAEITTIEYVSSGLVKYTLSTPSLGIFQSDGITPELITNVVAEGIDKFTANNCGYAVNNGSFIIDTITAVGDTLEIIVRNPDVVEVSIGGDTIPPPYNNEVDVGGNGGIFTDLINTTTSNRLLIGDLLTGGGLPSSALSVLLVNGAGVYVDGVTEETSISDGVTIFGRRTASVIPVNDVTEYTAGDMLTYSGHNQLSRIKYIWEPTDKSTTMVGSLVTIDDTTGLHVGQKIIILTDSTDRQIYTVASINSLTEFTVEESFTSSTGTLVGGTIEIDEEVEYNETIDNTVSFSSTQYWRAIEHPEYTADRLKDIYTHRYYDSGPFENQPYVRSASVADNLYFTNGDDEVYRYDGENITQAGLHRWEGIVFNSVTEVGTGGIVFNQQFHNLANSEDNIAGRTITFPDLASISKFTVGDRIQIAGEEGIFVVEEIDTGKDASGPFKLTVDTNTGINISGTGVTRRVSTLAQYKYYFRLNLVDIHGNLIGSAVTGSGGDFNVTLSDNSDVTFKLKLPPILGNYDYENLQLEVYRTKLNGNAFFRVTSLPVSYEENEEYISFTDTTSDFLLSDADEISTSLFGAELANGIDAPLRARYVTSANNRLILGNLSDYPQIELQAFAQSSTSVSLNDFNGLQLRVNRDGNIIQSYQFFDTSTANNTTTFVRNVTGFTAPSGTPPQFTINMASGIGGLGSGDKVYVFKSDVEDTTPASCLGWFTVLATSGIGNRDVLVKGSNSLSSTLSGLTNIKLATFASATIPIVTDADYNYSSSLVSPGGVIGFSIRLSKALNNNQIDTPALIATGDSDFGAGQLFIRQPIAEDSTVTLEINDSNSNVFDNIKSSLYVNGNLATLSQITFTSFSLQTFVYPSRLLVSFSNFPEIFDRPRARTDVDSQSIIDINSADGQEITGIIPFFGESTSQDSRKQDIVICFKENSIYAVNISTKSITKIDSRGIGCTAPYSIANVPNGIIFANESGVYVLDRSFNVNWVGRRIDRKWKEKVNLSRLDLCQGHIYPREQQYKLSYPLTSTSENTEVFVYDYGDAGTDIGGWSQYDNHQATGWANLQDTAYYGTSKGRVYSIRKLNEDSDFRDDDQAISFSYTHRPLHFGEPGRRKIVRRIVSNFRVLADSDNTSLQVATDMSSAFSSTSSFKIDASEASDNLSDSIGKKVLTIRHSIPTQRGNYFQLQYTNNGIDEPVEIAGISFVVNASTDAGILEASDTENN